MRLRLRLLLPFVFLASLRSEPVPTTWSGSSSSDWNNAANWSNGVPASNVGTTIGIGEYSPVLSGNQQTGQLVLNPGGTGTASLDLAAEASLITNGFAFLVPYFEGDGSSTRAQVTLSSGSTWKVTGELWIADSGRGTVEGAGANLEAARIYLGWNSNAHGILSLTGGSLKAAEIHLAAVGVAELRVEGCTVFDVGVINVGHASGGQGTLTLAQSNSFGTSAEPATTAITIERNGKVTNEDGAFNTLKDLTLYGGELKTEGGNSEFSAAWELQGTVTVGGSEASVLTVGNVHPELYEHTAIRIGGNMGDGATTFDVADVTGSAAADLTIDNIIRNNRSDGHSALIKTGSGTLLLTSASTYSGGTMIQAGTLVANGQYAGSSAGQSSLGLGSVVVNCGATLAGVDFIAGAVTIQAGGHLAPGDPTAACFTGGAMRFDTSLTLDAGSILDFTLGERNSTWLQMGDSTLLHGATVFSPEDRVVINIFDAGDFIAGTYALINFGEDMSFCDFDLEDFVFGTTISGYEFALDMNMGEGQLQVIATAVPEPATYAGLFGAGALGLALWRRRRMAA